MLFAKEKQFFYSYIRNLYVHFTFIQLPKTDPLYEEIITYSSSVGCHCNAAGYFIGMPGPNGGDGGDYYCDANFVGGQW